jgi:hypothetical protein
MVEFLTKDEVAIGISLDSPVPNPDFAMLVLFSSFALRQMHNLGTSHPVTQSLASALAAINKPDAQLVILLGPPDLSLNQLQQASRDGASDPMQNFVSVDSFKLAPYRNQKGKKRFLSSLTYDEHQARLLMDLKGFDFMGRGVNYYAPLSVGLLFRRLVSLQGQHSEYLPSLVYTANLSGKALLSGTITSTSQPFLALQVAQEAAQYTKSFNP